MIDRLLIIDLNGVVLRLRPLNCTMSMEETDRQTLLLQYAIINNVTIAP